MELNEHLFSDEPLQSLESPFAGNRRARAGPSPMASDGVLLPSDVYVICSVYDSLTLITTPSVVVVMDVRRNDRCHIRPYCALEAHVAQRTQTRQYR